MAGLWSMYGVRKNGAGDKAGVGPLPETKRYECGICGYTFDHFRSLEEFYGKHYSTCGNYDFLED